MTYKLGDAVGQNMLSPMIVHQGFSDTDYIAINKLVGFWCLVIGSLVAGGLIATFLSFSAFVGGDFVIIMYSGVVLGGMGSILGAFWGGLTVGFVQQFSALVLRPQLQKAAI